MKIVTISLDVREVLESFDMNPREFYDILDIGNYCSGIPTINLSGLPKYKVNCDKTTCTNCKLRSNSTASEISDWLGLPDFDKKLDDKIKAEALRKQHRDNIEDISNRDVHYPAIVIPEIPIPPTIEERLNKLEKQNNEILDILRNNNKLQEII